jgi:hypothetical protein
MILIKGENFIKGVRMLNKRMMIRLIVSRNLENKVHIMNLLQKINLLIYQNIFHKEKINIPLKIITIAIKNTKTIINLMKHEKIRQKIVNKEKRKEMKTQKLNKRQKNLKMGINIKASNQNQ